MQYTIRDIPPHLDEELRARAKQRGLSLNKIVIDSLLRVLGLSTALPHQPLRSLSDIAHSWQSDAEAEQAIDQQRTIDTALWE